MTGKKIISRGISGEALPQHLRGADSRHADRCPGAELRGSRSLQRPDVGRRSLLSPWRKPCVHDTTHSGHGYSACPAIAARLIAAFRPDTTAQNTTILALSALFFVFLIWNLLHDLAQEERPTGERIAGALCAYIFIGISSRWSTPTWSTDSPGSFAISNQGIGVAASEESSLLPVFTYLQLCHSHDPRLRGHHAGRRARADAGLARGPARPALPGGDGGRLRRRSHLGEHEGESR